MAGGVHTGSSARLMARKVVYPFSKSAELPRAEIEASFMADGIHLTEEGSRRVTEFLQGCLEGL